MSPSAVPPLSQEGRRPSSLPLQDADLSLGNANWTKGLQAMSDWIWSGNLNPVAFPNHLARYFLQIPAIFEQQLNFSTTLIFDLPSFRNGIQVSGFVDRITRELCISLVAQRRRCWYSMTHHAVLGRLTALQAGMSEADFAAKWSRLTEHRNNAQTYTEVERQALIFADAFATNPKAYTDADYQALRAALAADNKRRYPVEGLWMSRLEAARAERATGLLAQRSRAEIEEACARAAAGVSSTMPASLNDRKVDAQVVELAFLCLQFVALSCVFTGLNIPDEDFLAGVMRDLLPDVVIAKLNELNAQGGQGLDDLVPPPVIPPLAAIVSDSVRVDPAPLRGARIPLRPYEVNYTDLDKGLTVGGVQVGVYGWSFGAHFPGSLVYALMLHPELARYEAPYSLPLLFNEDEWRNGVHTGGFVSRLLKELVYQNIYKTTRSRYGLEHHTMFLYNSYLDEHGVGRAPRPQWSTNAAGQAQERALARAEAAVLYITDHERAPAGVFSPLELATLSWTHRLITAPHSAWELEGPLRQALETENRFEIRAGLRRLDTSPGLGVDAAMKRLVDHQIAELAMLIGHMDGLGRALTILRLESEGAVQAIVGTPGPSGDILPTLDSQGQVQFTGYYNNRPGLLQILSAIGVSTRAQTVNELMVNPRLNEEIHARLAAGEQNIRISAAQAIQTGEF